MKISTLIFILIVFTFSSSLNSCVYTGEENNRNNFDKTLSIQELNGQKTKPGIYGVEGFVIEKYSCPTCPRFTNCEPCRRGNSIVVSAENKKTDGDDLTEKEILLHTDNPDSFEQGKKYLFKVELTDEKLPNDPDLKYCKIIDYKRLN